jgi:hypothetical protein
MLDAHGKVPSLAWIVRALQFVTFINGFSDQPQELSRLRGESLHPALSEKTTGLRLG